MMAAESGHMDVLKWAREKGCPWDPEEICALAAGYGRLDMLKWARENGCPWSELARDMAYEGGHLHVLRWAQENGCPWSKGALGPRVPLVPGALGVQSVQCSEC